MRLCLSSYWDTRGTEPENLELNYEFGLEFELRSLISRSVSWTTILPKNYNQQNYLATINIKRFLKQIITNFIYFPSCLSNLLFVLISGGLVMKQTFRNSVRIIYEAHWLLKSLVSYQVNSVTDSIAIKYKKKHWYLLSVV